MQIPDKEPVKQIILKKLKFGRKKPFHFGKVFFKLAFAIVCYPICKGSLCCFLVQRFYNKHPFDQPCRQIHKFCKVK